MNDLVPHFVPKPRRGETMRKMKDKAFRRISTGCLAISLLLTVFLIGCRNQSEDVSPETDTAVPETVIEPTESVQKEMSVTELMGAVLSVKEDLKTVLNSIQEEDLQYAESMIGDITQNTQTIRVSLNATIANLVTDGCNMGVKSLNEYLNQYKAADEVSKDITKRLINLEEKLAVDIREYL